jgi:hypothetical protein
VIEGSLERVLPTLEPDSVDFIDLLCPMRVLHKSRLRPVSCGRSGHGSELSCL